MTDENEDLRKDTGRDAELKNACYTPVTKQDLAPPEQPELTKADAAQAIAERRQEDNPLVLETTWTDKDPDKPAAFDVDAAAELVKQSREKFAADNIEPAQDFADAELAEHIDRLQGRPTESDIAAERWRAQQAAERQAAEHAELQQRILAQHQANQTRTADIEAETIRARGNAVVAQLTTEFPEIANLPLNQIQSAVAAIEQRDPARARALVDRLRAVDAIYGQHKAAQQRQQQHATQAHAEYVKSQGQAFERTIANDPPARRQAVYNGVVQLLQQSGVDLQAFATATHDPSPLGKLLASASVQRLLYTAAAAMIDGKSHSTEAQQLRDKLLRDVPPVQRPGTSNPQSGRELAGAALNSKLNAQLSTLKGDAALKAATQLLLSRRGAR